MCLWSAGRRGGRGSGGIATLSLPRTTWWVVFLSLLWSAIALLLIITPLGRFDVALRRILCGAFLVLLRVALWVRLIVLFLILVALRALRRIFIWPARLLLPRPISTIWWIGNRSIIWGIFPLLHMELEGQRIVEASLRLTIELLAYPLCALQA